MSIGETLKVHSRVRIVSVTLRAVDSRALRCNLMQCLDATGTIINFDPRWTLPFRVRLDNDDLFAFAEDNLEVLEAVQPLVPKEAEPRNIEGSSEPLQQLTEAIGRHPTAETDPSVIDALNAVEDALRQKEAG